MEKKFVFLIWEFVCLKFCTPSQCTNETKISKLRNEKSIIWKQKE